MLAGEVDTGVICIENITEVMEINPIMQGKCTE